MAQNNKLSLSIIRRLPRYYRYARELLGTDVLRISSSELASMMGVTASQIRQDLCLLGGFGQQGYGYNIRDIYDGVGDILGINRGWSVVIVGVSGIGEALAKQSIFMSRGIKLAGIFDYGSAVGREIAGITVSNIIDITAFCRETGVDIAVLCVPGEQAEEACALSVAGGVRGIWNLTGAELRPERAGKKIQILDMNIGDCLLGLCCELNVSSVKNSDNTDNTHNADK